MLRCPPIPKYRKINKQTPHFYLYLLPITQITNKPLTYGPPHPPSHPSAFEPHAVRSWVRHSGGPAPRHPLPHAAKKLRFCVAATALSRRFYPLNRGIERCYRSFHKQCAKTCASVCCRCGHVPRSVCATGLVALPKCPTVNKKKKKNPTLFIIRRDCSACRGLSTG